MIGRRARARDKLELVGADAAVAAASKIGGNLRNGGNFEVQQVTEEDISLEILRVDGERKIEFGMLEEGRMNLPRAKILYGEALHMLEGIDSEGTERARRMLAELSGKEFEFDQMLSASNRAARDLWDERAAMLCRQARSRTEKCGGPSMSQFDSNVAANAPAVMRECNMASYGARIVFRPTFDSHPMPATQRAEGTSHAVNHRPLNERIWLHTESLYNTPPGKLALAKFATSLEPTFPTTHANYFAIPRSNMSSGLVNAPESERPDFRVLPIGPANLPRPPQFDP